MTADDPRVLRARDAVRRDDSDHADCNDVTEDLLAAYDERSEQKALAENHRIAANERAEAAEAERDRLRACVDRMIKMAADEQDYELAAIINEHLS